MALPLVWLTWRKRRGRHRLVLPEHPAGQAAPPRASPPGQACDVFICHRGPDVKGDLVGHLEERLKRANLIVFVDYGMPKGVESWAHVLATLRGARGVLILLTPGFEESHWCLEEARAVAARLNDASGAGAPQVAVLPVFIDREASWDEGRCQLPSKSSQPTGTLTSSVRRSLRQQSTYSRTGAKRSTLWPASAT